MSALFENTLRWLAEDDNANLLSQCMHGIEKEGLRVTPTGELAQTAHPTALGSALTHSFVTTDYSEALLEFITPVFAPVEDALAHLDKLHRFTYTALENELVWAGSMPCDIPNEEAIPVAQYGDSNIGKMKTVYREGLKHRYGKLMQTIAGIHYNFSFPDSFWQAYGSAFAPELDLQTLRSEGYFKLIRNFRRDSWILLYLFGASPALCASFMADKPHNLESLDKDTLYLPYATSLRMSDLGYSNKAQASLGICYNQLSTYADSLQSAIRTPYAHYQDIGIKDDEGNYQQLNSNILQIENEYYSDIRPKRVAQSGEKPVAALQARGVEYVEVRSTDINPFLPLGIDTHQAKFTDLFLVGCLLEKCEYINNDECERISENHQRIVTRGRDPQLTLLTPEGEVPVKARLESILGRLAGIAKTLDTAAGNTAYQDALALQQAKVDDASLTPSAQ
ncbi:MAG: glutamate--cysteine ligase, partial [Pontibacterium sp.]